MKQPKSIQFILSVGKDEVIPSVNSLYKARIVYNFGKPTAAIYKGNDAKKIITRLDDQLRQIDFPTKAPWIFDKNAIFDLQIQAIFKQNLFMRDCDNLAKLLQDTLFRHLGLNDSRVVNITISKALCPDLPEEKICFNLAQSTSEVRFDKLEGLPTPERIFLGGTRTDWNGSQWRDEVMKELTSRKYSFFNPVVDDWTPECITKEIKEKEELCDCHLYILTPAMKGVQDVAEIVNSAYEVKMQNSGSCLFGLLGTKEDWGEEQWNSLNATVNLVNNISGGSKKIVAKVITDPIELLTHLGTPKRKRKKKDESTT